MSLRRRALFLAGLFVAVSCSDAGNPLEPGPRPQPKPEDVLQALDCSVSVGGSFSCAPMQPGAGGAQGSGFTYVGGQNVYVQLAASNFVNTPSDSTLQIDVTIKNLIPQALGTTDGVTEDPYGVRVWFLEDPVTNPGGLMASVRNPDGFDFFSNANQAYFEYDTIIKPDSVSGARSWRLKYDPAAGPSATIFFRVLLRTQVKWEAGWVDVTPDVDTVAPGATVQLTAVTRNKLGDTTGVSQNVTWTSSNPDIATVDANGLVTGDSAGTVYIKADPQGVQAPDSALIVVNSEPTIIPDTVEALSNVLVHDPAPGVLVNANDGDAGQSVWVVAADSILTANGVAWIEQDGALQYLSNPGYSGRDSIPFMITDSITTRPAYAIVEVGSSPFWYVKPGGEGLADGRQRHPFATLAAAQAVANEADSILVLTNGPTPVSGSVTLDSAQAIIGQGIPTSITRVLNGQTVTILAAGSQTGLTSSSGSTITLNRDNVIQGVAIGATGGATGISGTTFGTLRLWYSNVGTTGPALSLTDGELDADSSVTLSGAGLSLANVHGSLTSTGGALTGTFTVAGGSVSVNYGGSITQGGSASLLAVSGNHTGTLAFAGTLEATAGNGLQFNDADGVYNFTGTTTLNGGDAGVDIGNGSDGTFAFGSNTAITSPSGTAFSVNGSTPTVFYDGNITQANAALLVDVSEQAADSVIFRTGTLSSTGGGRILLSNADGVVRFTGTVNLNGGGTGVDIAADANGSLTFGSGTSITHASGTGLAILSSAPSVGFGGSITSSGTGRPVVVDAASPCGTVNITGAINSTGQGIVVQDCSAGTVAFSGAKTLNTGANQAVTLFNNTGGAIAFSGGNLGITTTSGIGFGATGGGEVTVTGGGNTISTGTGTGLSLNGVSTGASGVVFGSVSTGAAANGIALNNLTGVGVTVNGGTISGTTGHGVSLTNLSSLTTGVVLNSLNVTTGTAGMSPVFGTTFGTLSVNGTALSATGGPALSLNTGGVSGTFSSLASSASNGAGVSLTGVTGTLNTSGGTITGGAGAAFLVSGGTVGGTIASAISQATAAQPTVLINGGHATGTLTFSNTVNATNGNGLQFDNADGTYAFSGTVTLNGGDAGIDVTNNSTGTFTFPATATITSPSTGNLISILNSAPTFSYSGAFTKANNNVTGILVQSNTGGTININGTAVTKSISSGTAAAVSLVNNSGATINFQGGSLVITSGSGAGFSATGGGTVNITGAGNTISSGTGTALNVQNTTIGASGLSFVSISHNGGANGIVLSNTGALNGMQVTGAGSAVGSGGSIVNTTGADGSTQGAGIYLNNTRAISLAFMALSGHANWAIRGNNVVGFTMNKTRITGTNGTSTATDDGSIYFTELTGSASITGSFIDGGFEDGVLVDNTTGTLNRITFDGDTIGSSSEISGDGLRLEASGGTFNATVQNTRFARAAGDMFQHNIIGNAQSDLVFQNNTLINGHPLISGGGGGVTITAAESGDLTYDINGNTIRGAKGVALVVNKPFGGSPGNGTMSGFIRNNVIGTAGATQNGSSEGSGMLIGLLAQGSHTTRIEDNQIYDYEEMGIFFNIGGTSQSVTGLTHNGTINATVVGNVIAEPLNLPGALAQNGIHLNAGTNSDGGNDAYQVCMDIGNGALAADRNTLTGSGAAGGTDFRLRQRFATTVRLPGYTGANNDNASVTSFVQGRNNGPPTGSVTNTVSTGGGGFLNTSPAGSACPQP